MKPSALVIDYKYCTGCHTCEIACRNEHDLPLTEWGIKLSELGPMKKPDGKWMWNYIPQPTDLCDLCEERVDAGLKPACVHHCLALCMEVVPLEDISVRMAELGKTAVCFVP